jgi:acetyl esterase/lipase
MERPLKGFQARALGALTVVVASISGAAPAAAQRDFPVADKPVLEDLYPDRATRFPGGVTGLADVVYSTLPGFRPLILDLYLRRASRSAVPKPLIIYIHGGGWVSGHTRHAGATANFPQVLAALAAEGFVVASLEYRLSGEAQFPAQLQDVRAAIRFLKANAGRYGLDPDRVGIWGGSAGGHLAALAALSCGAPGFDDKPQPKGSECVQAAVTWYGVFDFAPVLARQGGAPNAMLGCAAAQSCPADKVAAASPLTYLDRSDPPFLLIHGSDDKTVPVAQSEEAYSRMTAAGAPVEKIIIAGVDHSFIGATPEATRAATLKALNATFDFFHRQLDRTGR